jgi:hypothetical protein
VGWGKKNLATAELAGKKVTLRLRRWEKKTAALLQDDGGAP